MGGDRGGGGGGGGRCVEVGALGMSGWKTGLIRTRNKRGRLGGFESLGYLKRKRKRDYVRNIAFTDTVMGTIFKVTAGILGGRLRVEKAMPIVTSYM